MADRWRLRPEPPGGEVPTPICRTILRAIATADVVALAFPRLQCTLVADLRPGGSDRPALFVAPPLRTAADAMAALAAHRPALLPVARYARATWGGSTDAFAAQGILTALLDRLSTEAGRGAMATFAELQEAERAPAARQTRAKVPPG
jgi:hypothetical protein